MNNDNKEKLIEMVRKYECIYNPKHKDYKNVSYKSLLWEKIGATLEIQGSKAKDAWRSLRDGYMRHKKTIRGQTGSSRKYSNFTWSSQMSFLDSTLELRPTSTNITPPQPNSDAPLSPSYLPKQSLPVGRQSPPTPRQSPPALMPSPPSSQPGPSWLYPEPEVDDSSQSILETLDLPSSTQLQQPSPTILQPSPSPASRTTKKKTDSRNLGDNTDRVLDYLKNKKKREWDDADYLFMSYAKSFKKLSVRNQGKIKVALAKLFADAELEDFENNSTNEGRNQMTSQQPSSLMYLSPAYSVLSDGSTETILITEEHIQQPMQPVLIAEETSHEPPQDNDVALAIDLTNHNSNESHEG